MSKTKQENGEMLKGTLDMMILRTLIGGDAPGHTIAKVIERTSEDGLELDQGSLYPAPHRLEDRGWVPLSFYGQTSEFHTTAREAHAGHDPLADVYQVSSGYFETIGIPWIAGRDFNSVDPGAPKQAVVNEAFARTIFGAGRAVGERVTSEKI